MRYDKNRFKIWALPHPLILHWVLNPIIMFNELLFGQRLPTVTLIDKKSDKPQLEGSYIPLGGFRGSVGFGGWRLGFYV